MEQDQPTAGERMHSILKGSWISRKNDAPEPEFTENAVTVMNRRYLVKDDEGNPAEEPRDMLRRVSENLSRADLNYGASQEEIRITQDGFYQVMRDLDFLPNSPTLMNAGRELQQLSACFVLPVEDSIDSIFSRVKDTALIHKSGGGTGFSFSRLRPSGDFVRSTGGIASGPASFIRAFDSATDVVKQGGTRRGANMGILNVDHPDILRFIQAKENGDLANFNISVAVNESFMEKVKHNLDYDLINPRTTEPVGRLNAQDVFRKIVDMAWLIGDPGLVFLDRINRDNPNPHAGYIESTNPCFAGTARLATDRGLLTFRELHLGQPDIQVTTDNRVEEIRSAMSTGGILVAVRAKNGTTLRPAAPVFRTRRDWPIFRLTTRHGFEVTATGDHRFFTPTELKELQHLEEGEEILIQSGRGVWNEDRSLPPLELNKKLRGRVQRGEANPPTEWSRELGEILGWVTGDGWMSEETPRGRTVPNRTVGMIFGTEEKKLLAPRFQQNLSEWLGMRGNASERHNTLSLLYKSSLHQLLTSLGMKPAKADQKEAPGSIWAAPRDAVIGFLSALFTADGTVNAPNNGCSIRLASSSRKLLQQVQLLLLNEGIVGKIYLRREAGAAELPDANRQPREYRTRAQYELMLDGQSRDTFMDEIGFLTPSKNEKAARWRDGRKPGRIKETFTDRVKSIEFAGTEDVYCTTEPETNSIVVNGLVAHNCGEQPLSPYESCNLGSVNLARMVRQTDEGPRVDWERLGRTIRSGVHMLDNVIDMNEYPLAQIEEASKNTRRIGLGVMGWADMLVQLGIRYDSQEALDLARAVMKFIRDETHRASRELAVRRGSYPAWEGSVYNPPADSGRETAQMRNSAPVTIAPTGTISIIAGASSGIEPLFALVYTRNVMDQTRMVEVNPYFEAVARSEGFHSKELMEEVARSGSLENVSVPPWVREVFRVAPDISPEWHVRMQAAFQEHTDNSVSKTINFPASATPQDIWAAYMLAYETGCKGITVYRDGSKPEQVLSVGRTGTREEETGGANGAHPHPHPSPRPRPRMMSGATTRVRTGHGNMYVTINVDQEGYPFEIFNTVGKAGGCDSAQIEAISRLVSQALRSGIEPSEITSQLRGITCCPAWDEGVSIRSIPDGVAYALDLHMGNTPVRVPANGARCPDCNAPVHFAEGCTACTDPVCGWNKCD